MDHLVAKPSASSGLARPSPHHEVGLLGPAAVKLEFDVLAFAQHGALRHQRELGREMLTWR